MCIAILNPENQIKDEFIKNSWDNNNQGGGLLYNHKGKLTIFKTYEYSEFLKKYKKLRKDKSIKKIVLHFRIATSGHIKYINLHPFLVNKNLGFVHNGIISGMGDKDHSDTYQFNEMLKKLDPNFLSNEVIKEFIRDYITSSKLIFLDSKDNHTIINEEAGIWDNGNFFSNDSYKESNDFEYFGNIKRSKFSAYFEDNHTTAAELQENEEEMAEALFYYDGANTDVIKEIANIIGVKHNSYSIVNEIGALAYQYNSYNLKVILTKLKEEQRLINNDDISYNFNY